MKSGAAVAGAGVLGAAAAYIGALRPRQLRWGATGKEVDATLVGDDLITALVALVRLGGRSDNGGGRVLAAGVQFDALRCRGMA